MPSLTTIVSAIVGGCVLVTLLLSYSIWSIHYDQAEIQRQRHSRQRADRYALQLLECNQRRARRVNPIFVIPIQDSGEQKECLPNEIHVAFPPGFSEDTLALFSQDLANVCISEELEMVELAEKVVRESGARQEPGASSPPL
ncbi:hypothetical protein OBBRIDRAFT_808550 [Obba rivulosa]|uniref:Uncharacterized protein n=1 Tax=Obba rivulosa TaxID=1052685 RepID=A0A8E2AH14_9APHY|nr:hypothetical protein OBBRIDRAFT_808550 [Obba rivulosa]